MVVVINYFVYTDISIMSGISNDLLCLLNWNAVFPDI
jgi:hypothetical protein